MLTRPIKVQPRRKLTPEQELAVVDAYNAGDSGITIAARFCLLYTSPSPRD